MAIAASMMRSREREASPRWVRRVLLTMAHLDMDGNLFQHEWNNVPQLTERHRSGAKQQEKQE
jgi:hypothetical protein